MTDLVPPWAGTGIPLADNDRGLDWMRDREVESAPLDAIRQESERRWRVQREYVAARSEFYRRKLGGSLDMTTIDLGDLSKLPFTTKQELQEAQREALPFGTHLAADPEAVKRVYQTSGTTGRPSLIALTRADTRIWRTIGSRSYYATSLKPHNSVLTTFGAGPFVAGHTHWVIEEIGARSVAVGPGDTDRVINALETGLVDTMLSTPTFAMYLADRFDQAGVDARRFGMFHLILGGEPGGGLPTIRDRIETAFAAQVTEAMGLGDVSPSLFGECPAQRGLHWSGQNLVWPELIDQHGEVIPIEDGAEGELVFTHLRREAMPVVRFRGGDHVAIQTTKCPCGRSSFTVRIAGRVDDMIIVRGVNVYPSAVQAIVAEQMPVVTGRVRLVVPPGAVSVDPPVPIEIEVPDGTQPARELGDELTTSIRERLKFRGELAFVPQSEFGSTAYKTRSIVRRDDG